MEAGAGRGLGMILGTVDATSVCIGLSTGLGNSMHCVSDARRYTICFMLGLRAEL